MIPEGFFKPGERLPVGDDITAVECGYIDGYRMVYLQTANNWSAYSPDVRGIYVGGDSRSNAEQRMREALPDHLALPDDPMQAPTPARRKASA